MTTPSNKIPQAARDFADAADWDKTFDLSIAALYFGFGLDENDIPSVLPPDLRSRARSVLPDIVSRFEGHPRGFCLDDPEGAVPAAQNWIEEQIEIAEATLPAGERQPIAEAAPAPASPPPVAPSEPRHGEPATAVPLDLSLLSLDNLLTYKPTPRPFVLADMVRVGEVTLLVGDSGTGKTHLVRQLAVRVAAGLPFIGHPTTSRPSIMLDCEMGRDDQAFYLAALVHKLGLDGKHLPIYVLDATQHLDKLTAESLTSILVDACKQSRVRLTGSLLVIDTLGELSCGAEENAAKEMLPVMRALRSLAHTFGVSIIITHHTVKGKENEKNALFRGSSAIRGAVDNLWYLAPEGKAGKGGWVLTCDKSRRGKPFQPLKLAREYIPAFGPAADSPHTGETAGFTWIPRDDSPAGEDHPQDITPAALKQGRTLAELLLDVGHLPYKDLGAKFTKALHLKKDSAKRAIRIAVQNGFLVKLESGDHKGEYALGPKGREWTKPKPSRKAAAE